MAAGFSGAVTAHREVRPRRQPGKQRDQMDRRWRSHFLAILARESLPPRVGEGLRDHPRKECRAGGEFRKPDVVVVPLRELGTGDSARGPANGPEPQAFIRMARRPQTNDPDWHATAGIYRRDYSLQMVGAIFRIRYSGCGTPLSLRVTIIFASESGVTGTTTVPQTTRGCISRFTLGFCATGIGCGTAPLWGRRKICAYGFCPSLTRTFAESGTCGCRTCRPVV